MIWIRAKDNWLAMISRGLLFLFIWWILTDGASHSWWIGVPIVFLALVSSTALLEPQPFRWYEFIKFIPFFLLRSLLGGVDVAWRAFHPSLPIVPDIFEYTTRLPLGMPQVFMANTISLLPGTLSATLDGGIIKVHVLDTQNDFMAELKIVEKRVARVFGVSLDLTDRDN